MKDQCYQKNDDSLFQLVLCQIIQIEETIKVRKSKIENRSESVRFSD